MTIEQIEMWSAYVFGVVLVLSPAFTWLRPHALAWVESSARTRTMLDDRASRAVLRMIDAFAWVIAFWPRVTIGLGEAKRTIDVIKSIERPPLRARTTPRVPPALVLLLVLPMSFATACGGAGIQTTRSALLITDGVVDHIDSEVAPLAADAHVRALSESSSREEYDRRMRPWVRVAAAITSVQTALLASATTVEAVEAGLDGDVLGTIGCTVEALAELAAMLPNVGVDVPPTLRTAIALLAELASDVCPAPRAPPAEDAGEGEVPS